eukprot:SAG11_NODE_9289_length_925_cov_1.237288_1_plen_41_part_10
MAVAVATACFWYEAPKRRIEQASGRSGGAKEMDEVADQPVP